MEVAKSLLKDENYIGDLMDILSKELTRYMNMTDEELEKEEKQINANSPDA